MDTDTKRFVLVVYLKTQDELDKFERLVWANQVWSYKTLEIDYDKQDVIPVSWELSEQLRKEE